MDRCAALADVGYVMTDDMQCQEELIIWRSSAGIVRGMEALLYGEQTPAAV